MIYFYVLMMPFYAFLEGDLKNTVSLKAFTPCHQYAYSPYYSLEIS